ncbi:Uncharacterised protein [Nocardia cyriacigeorgica]|uniref:Uncharacterized protein n=1 Tax=Nocardia cyriacigeorgica TaxID=135487 RepID=A0A4U8W3L3_9NOCA|nr:Uncharacterised protein [Nocardia cyriacigeorgica]
MRGAGSLMSAHGIYLLRLVTDTAQCVVKCAAYRLCEVLSTYARSAQL